MKIEDKMAVVSVRVPPATKAALAVVCQGFPQADGSPGNLSSWLRGKIEQALAAPKKPK